jgi:hypothetical protein
MEKNKNFFFKELNTSVTRVGYVPHNPLNAENVGDLCLLLFIFSTKPRLKDVCLLLLLFPIDRPLLIRRKSVFFKEI